MNDNSFQKKQEDKLDTFLKTYAPSAPLPRSGEKERLLRTILLATHHVTEEKSQGNNKSVLFSGWLKWVMPIAATAAIGFFVINYSLQHGGENKVTLSDDELSLYLEDSLAGLYSDSHDDATESVASLSEFYEQLPDQIGEGQL